MPYRLSLKDVVGKVMVRQVNEGDIKDECRNHINGIKVMEIKRLAIDARGHILLDADFQGKEGMVGQLECQ
jgi:hypothetical protein